MTVVVKGYEETKYTASEKAWEMKYEDVASVKVVTGADATAIGNETDEASRDEFNEYLVLSFADGSEATFRNSHVDAFRY